MLLFQACLRNCWTFGIALTILVLSLSPVAADDPVVITGQAKPVAAEAQRATPSGPQTGKQPAQQGAATDNPEAAGKSKQASPAQNESPEPKVIRRDDSNDESADPDELKAMVGDDGRVAFQFRNQPWVELVQWLADISEQPLDWLELPGDRVNMRSPGRYTVVETRDLFNRHLLARGYTLLEIDGGLTVAKTANINPAIVPRVDVADLSALAPYTFVRTSLDVGWLSAQELAKELQPMISGNGKLTALKTTNRIEAMDAAINLSQVAALLDQEHNLTSREALAPEMKLRYLPAEEAKRMLEQFLGIEKKKETPLTPQQIQMMQQQRQQNQNQNPQPVPKKIEIAIVANPRQNSVIIRAPPDRVAIAMEFLKRVDVPSESMASLSDIETRVQVFRLASLDPEKLIEIIGEMNVLEPTTRIRADKTNNALIVSGSGADRYIINSLIKRLDGSGRSFEVLPLRRLDPVEVAESIAFLMGQEQEDDNKNSRQRYYYSYYDRNNKDESKKQDKFRVAANARFRQVLLWANEQEMAEVRSLLIKLGELPPPGGNRNTIRIIDASATPETYEYLQRLRQQWNRLAPNPLELPAEDKFTEPNEIPRGDAEQEGESPEASEKPKMTDDQDDQTLAGSSKRHQLQLAAMQDETATDDEDTGGKAPIRSAEDFDRAFGPRQSPQRNPEDRDKPPASIRIDVDSAGNIVLVSPDTDALDQLENLMLQVAPPKRPYQVFHIKHASALWMKLNLEDYFKDLDDQQESESDRFYRYFWGNDQSDSSDKGPSGLGKGIKLRFVDDIDTNTLVVSGATSSQLRTIAELIELWDVPEPVNKRRTRFTKLVNVQFGRAEKIAETVKEAYRDLLSSNDKAFTAGKGQNQAASGNQNQATKSRDGNGSSLQDSESGRDGGGADFSFKGKLSIGIDSVGNTLLVSAEGEPLLKLVSDMISQLDQAARPTGEVQVIQIPGGVSGQALQLALQAFGAEPPNVKDSGRRGDDKQNRNDKQFDDGQIRERGAQNENYGVDTER